MNHQVFRQTAGGVAAASTLAQPTAAQEANTVQITIRSS